jgi:hypothetical protein
MEDDLKKQKTKKTEDNLKKKGEKGRQPQKKE